MKKRRLSGTKSVWFRRTAHSQRRPSAGVYQNEQVQLKCFAGATLSDRTATDFVLRVDLDDTEPPRLLILMEELPGGQDSSAA